VDLGHQCLQEVLRVFVFPLCMEDTHQDKDSGSLERLVLQLPANTQHLECLLLSTRDIIPLIGKPSQAKQGPSLIIEGVFSSLCLYPCLMIVLFCQL
jgi:hypothetical protein